MAKNSSIKLYYFPRELVYLIKREFNTYSGSIKIGDKGNTLMVAHRGLSSIHRENSLASFNAAGRLSYYGIETDVHSTSDGKYVIIHDDVTGRVACKDVKVEASTMDALRSVQLKVKNGEDTPEARTIPTLEEYIECCKANGKVGVLELKNHFEPKLIQEIVDIINKAEYLDKMVFISFDLANCVCLRSLCPDNSIQYLTARYERGLIDMLMKERLDVDIYCYELNASRIAKFHEAGIKVNCWTVDNVKFARKLIGWKVDYITTNVLE